MAYIQGGEVKSSRSPWTVRFVSDTFWAFVSFILSFIKTMFSIEATNSYGQKKSGGRQSGYGGGPSGPGGGPNGGGGGGDGRGPRGPTGLSGLSNVRGIDHSAPAPCGSCCGG